MKKVLPLIMISYFTLGANSLTLTPKQEKNWQIQTALPQKSQTLPLGEYMLEAKTPPYFLRAITLAFDVQVTQLYVAPYQQVDKGVIVADVSSATWIDAQTDVISNIIAYREYKTKAYRKNRLCKEGVIPKKECITINANLQNVKAKLSASKAVLSAYGADDTTILELEKSLKIKPTLSLLAPVSGTIVELHAQVGKSVNASTPLMVFEEEGRKWLETFMPQKVIKILQQHQDVVITIEGKSYPATVINFSPIINRQNQTRHVRFILNEDAKLLSGFRTNATISIPVESYKIPKKSIVKVDGKYALFMKHQQQYKQIFVDVLSEDANSYYIATHHPLSDPIVTTSVATLKSLLGESDE
jgi:hypothetical protein